MAGMLQLGKSVAEYENPDDLRALWEAPDGYDHFLQQRPWIIYGRKGSGKSTLIDYLKLESVKSRMIVIRPREGEFFQKILPAFQTGVPDRLVVESIIGILDLLLCVATMRLLLEDDAFYTGPESVIYEFLTKNGLHEGSVLRKALKYVEAVTSEFKLIHDLSSALDKVDGPSFRSAREAMEELLHDSEEHVTVCIDEIDDIGFDYSHEDRMLVNAMLAFCMRANTIFYDHKVHLHVLLSLPEELFYHAQLWNFDKALAKSHHIHWSDPAKLHALVNKRIGVELKIRRRSPRFFGDRFSHDLDQTWRRLFPDFVYSKLGRREGAFSYLLRHTFYTPRHVLSVCQAVLNTLNDRGYAVDDAAKIDDSTWTDVFQRSVEEYSVDTYAALLSVFERIYDGLEATLNHFSGRPNIWSHANLMSFLRNNIPTVIKRRDKNQDVAGEDLIAVLFDVGFIGFGVLTPEPHSSRPAYSLHFSYLGYRTRPHRWDVAVVSPLFYDSLRVRSAYGLPVIPHEKLHIPPSELTTMNSYDAKLNV
jgi:hypothetical protein